MQPSPNTMDNVGTCHEFSSFTTIFALPNILMRIGCHQGADSIARPNATKEKPSQDKAERVQEKDNWRVLKL